ncbi:MAG: hypothetical protein ACRDWX_11885, partial [Acidimicrobiia bacterium]
PGHRAATEAAALGRHNRPHLSGVPDMAGSVNLADLDLGDGDYARPPLTVEAAPLSGAASPSPATVRRRPLVEGPGYAPHHPYVRRYRTAVLGPGAVADLLRLMTAARRGRALRQPLHLAELARAGLVRFEQGRVWVRETVPSLSPRHVRRLPPALRGEHQRM